MTTENTTFDEIKNNIEAALKPGYLRARMMEILTNNTGDNTPELTDGWSPIFQRLANDVAGIFAQHRDQLSTLKQWATIIMLATPEERTELNVDQARLAKERFLTTSAEGFNDIGTRKSEAIKKLRYAEENDVACTKDLDWSTASLIGNPRGIVTEVVTEKWKWFAALFTVSLVVEALLNLSFFQHQGDRVMAGGITLTICAAASLFTIWAATGCRYNLMWFSHRRDFKDNGCSLVFDGDGKPARLIRPSFATQFLTIASLLILIVGNVILWNIRVGISASDPNINTLKVKLGAGAFILAQVVVFFVKMFTGQEHEDAPLKAHQEFVNAQIAAAEEFRLAGEAVRVIDEELTKFKADQIKAYLEEKNAIRSWLPNIKQNLTTISALLTQGLSLLKNWKEQLLPAEYKALVSFVTAAVCGKRNVQQPSLTATQRKRVLAYLEGQLVIPEDLEQLLDKIKAYQLSDEKEVKTRVDPFLIADVDAEMNRMLNQMQAEGRVVVPVETDAKTKIASESVTKPAEPPPTFVDVFADDDVVLTSASPAISDLDNF